jgi:hypothetical protein
LLRPAYGIERSADDRLTTVAQRSYIHKKKISFPPRIGSPYRIF